MTMYDNNPAPPVITRCTTTSIGGRETTAGTVVRVFNQSAGGASVSRNPATVEAGDWFLTPDTPLAVGDMVYAVAYVVLPDGSLGASSSPSSSHSVSAPENADKPFISVYTGEYFAGTEATPGTMVNVFNVSKHLERVVVDPVRVENGAWSMVADYPADPGDIVYAIAYWEEEGDFPPLASGPSETRTVDPAAVWPFPPEIDFYSSGIVGGSTALNSYVSLTVAGVELSRVASEDGRWQVSVGSLSPATVLSATACYLGGASSEVYVRQIGVTQNGPLIVTEVGESQISGIAPQPGQQILAWRGSDGRKVVDYTLRGTALEFTASYLEGMSLASGDLLYSVSAYPNYGPMTPYNVKPEGYSSS